MFSLQPTENTESGKDTPSSLVFYNDNDAYCAQWLRNLGDAGLLPVGFVDERSILDIEPGDLAGYSECHFFAGIGGWPYALQLAGWRGPVWTGSCPCQPLSSAGLGRGHADERHLWPAFYALIAECRPATIFGEQVASKAGREWLAGVRADLEHLGYALGCADLPAASVGAPHIRQRLFWVAYAECGNERGKRRRLLQLGAGRDEREHAAARRPQWDATLDQRQPSKGCDDENRQLAQSGGAGSGDIDRPFGDEEWRAVDTGPKSLRQGHGSSVRDGLGSTSVNGGLGDAASEPMGRARQSWEDSVWLPCLDGKARRVEPTIFPLAHAGEWGFGSRVGILRGAGNAIVPEVAAQFVRAFMECLIEIIGKSEERTTAHE